MKSNFKKAHELTTLQEKQLQTTPVRQRSYEKVLPRVKTTL